ncbi:hypothetical protein, partial [Methylobacterium indicum]
MRLARRPRPRNRRRLGASLGLATLALPCLAQGVLAQGEIRLDEITVAGNGGTRPGTAPPAPPTGVVGPPPPAYAG